MNPSKPQSLAEPEGSFGFLMHDVARLLRVNFNRRVQLLGLTQAQCRVILHLSRNEGIQQVALAEILEVQPVTLARLLDKLEAASLIERRRDPSDRRAFCLFLTASAHPLREQIWALGAEVRDEAVRGLDEQTRAQFITTLQTMKENLLRIESVAPVEHESTEADSEE
jgi:MarR family transcriptional regulator for hemolysin